MFVTVTTFSEQYKRHNCCSCTFLHSLPLPLPLSKDQVNSSVPSLGDKQIPYSHSTDTKAELKIRGLRHHSSGYEQYSLLGYDSLFLTTIATWHAGSASKFRVSEGRTAGQNSVSVQKMLRPAGHLDQGFPWFFSVLRQTLSRYANSTCTACLWCSPSNVGFKNSDQRRHPPNRQFCPNFSTLYLAPNLPVPEERAGRVWEPSNRWNYMSLTPTPASFLAFLSF